MQEADAGLPTVELTGVDTEQALMLIWAGPQIAS